MPEQVVSNADLERMVETSDEWIKSRTGISERRVCSDDESTTTLAIEAGRRALAKAGVEPDDLDLVVVASCTDARLLPAMASYVQDALGARRAGAFDIDTACTGFIAALAVASGLITTGSMKRILVIGSDAVSRFVDWTDRGQCILFGDGAGAVVVEASEKAMPMSFYLRNDGSAAAALTVPSPLGRKDELPDNGQYLISMDGPAIFRFAVEAMADASREVCRRSGLTLDDFALVIPHQANMRIIQAAARMLKIPMEKVYTNVEFYGNTSSGSVPIALAEAADQGRLAPGDKVLLVGFGAGMSWGALAMEWTATTGAPSAVAPALAAARA